MVLSRPIATVCLEEPWRAYSASSPVLWGLLHDLSWCSLGKITWPAKYACEAALVPVSTRFCFPVVYGGLTPVSSIEGTLTASIGCRRVTSRPTLLDGDNSPRAFAVSSTAAWNSLPAGFCDPNISIPSFREKLKTYLFNTPTGLSCLIIQLTLNGSMLESCVPGPWGSNWTPICLNI